MKTPNIQRFSPIISDAPVEGKPLTLKALYTNIV